VWREEALPWVRPKHLEWKLHLPSLCPMDPETTLLCDLPYLPQLPRGDLTSLLRCRWQVICWVRFP
jgi:hypothetical protein